MRLSWSSKWRVVIAMDRGISVILVSPSRSGHGQVEPQAPGTDDNRALLRQLGLQDPGTPAPTLSRCDLGKVGPSVRCREVTGSRSPSRMITKAGQAAGSAPRHHRRATAARKLRRAKQNISAESSVAPSPIEHHGISTAETTGQHRALLDHEHVCERSDAQREQDAQVKMEAKRSSERHDTRQERMAEGSEASELSDLTDKLDTSSGSTRAWFTIASDRIAGKGK
ncbi:hypothetical protein CABS03_05680 [Colletotrichum abscissum]|uniref:Uncharacterized protein n=1 Tax=Colletotrichum abscissum TaxID=1671311 RepID=A0A9Q0AZJ3_9PEZI|nr:hypothetical protein CABS02_10591 [Colletotrichum abscissum]